MQESRLTRWAYFFIGIAVLSSSTIPATATDNPVDGGVHILFVYEDPCGKHILWTDVWFEDSVWLPENNGWDNCYTSQSRKYQHAHFPHGFPFPHPDAPWFYVTAEMSDAFWDIYYGGYQRIASSSCARNCHGYSTGMGFWVDPPGMEFVLQDNWHAIFQPVVSAIIVMDIQSYNHSIKINSVHSIFPCGPKKVKRTIEKNGPSGVYQMTHSPLLEWSVYWKRN